MSELKHELGCTITELESKIVTFVHFIQKDAPLDDIATQITLLLSGTRNVLKDFYEQFDEKEKNDS